MIKNKLSHYPLVSIVTVNYNHSETTIELIESLSKITYPNMEIIVVDNASPDDEPAIIKEKYPSVILIESVINYGFAGGNNLGIMKARGDYVLLLNNDVIVPADFLEPLVLKFINEPAYGAISPKIHYYHTLNTIQYAGFTPIDSRTVRNTTIGQGEIDKGQYDHDYETAYAHGAAMMVPMDVIKHVGMMSYEFFLYYEEADWCNRIRKAGYKIGYVGNSKILHKESVTTGKLSVIKVYYLTRNRLVYMRRNIHGTDFIISLMYQIFIAIGKNAISYLLKGNIRIFWAYIRAILWNIKNVFNVEIHDNPSL
ncbi:MAG: glycosyltransferase [Bacteroidales bacterium]|nr:glycosyltransferase [Bacteroidales bacterium]